MGCGGSKIDDLPLVVRCRERKELIKAASDHRYALAAAHVLYFHSLRDVGEAIRRFVDEELVIASSSASPGSPVLTLPSREGKSKSKTKNSSSSTSISHSADSSGHKKSKNKEEEDIEDSHFHLSSGSDLDSDSGHIHIHDSDEEEVEKRGRERERPSFSYGYPPEQEVPSSSYGYPHEEEVASTSYGFNGYPQQPQGNWGYNDAGYNPYPYQHPYTNPDPNMYQYSNPNSNMYYMKKSATPAKTVVYEDPVVNGYSSFYGNAGYFGYPAMGSPPTEPSPPRPPPAPPSPPKVSAWDFLNVFESYDSYTAAAAAAAAGGPGFYSGGKYGYASTTSSPDSKEVREREGIPDLEDETEHEVIKEVHKEKKKAKEDMNINGNRKFDQEVHKNYYGEGSSKSVPVNQTSSESMDGKEIKSSASPDTFNSTESIISKSPDEESVRKKGVSFEVEEASVMDFDSSKDSSLTTLSSHGTRDLQEVVKEIKDEFETASSHGREVASLLEVGRLPYQKRTTLLRVIFSRILYFVSSHPPTTRSSVRISSRTMKIAKAYTGDSGDDFDRMSRNLSSTLDEIYAWEKKLYKHVKDEERLRVIYEKECKRLRSLDEHGAESSKIDATQASIRKLLTKLNVNIGAIDAISSKIHMLRDKELQPRVAELIHGMIRMWKSILRCHQKQFRAVMESKICSLRANTGAQKDSGLRATLELESELINWCTCFINWIKTQKTYIESLNGWLLRCILIEREETADGTAPFSPNRMGAPPIFVLCNDWYQAMDRISEKAVENAMVDFASSLHQLWERQDEEQRQRIKAEYLTKDFEKRLRTLRTEKGKLSQEHDALSDKAMSKVPSDSGVSPLDDLKVDLDSMRKKLDEERTRHKEATKLVHAAASGSLQAGLAPIFEALGSFTSEVVKGHEQVRLENHA